VVRCMRCFAILLGVLVGGPVACRVQAHALDDVLDRNLDGSYALSSTALTEYLGEPCPDGAVGRGWSRGGESPVSAAWCVDAYGLLQGVAVVKEPGCSTRIGHYRDGVADGAFSEADVVATYAHGLLEGPCHSSFDMLTYRQGRVEGAFTWSFGVHEDDEREPDPDLHGCHDHTPTVTVAGSVRGTFANGIAVDKFVVGSSKPVVRTLPPGVIDMTGDPAPLTWSEREIPIKLGVAVEIPELGDDAKDFAELLGPAHRWAGWPTCPYRNDSVAHYTPLP
jgi:hypothetical protein